MSDKGARLEVGDDSYTYDIVPATVGSDGIEVRGSASRFRTCHVRSGFRQHRRHAHPSPTSTGPPANSDTGATRIEDLADQLQLPRGRLSPHVRDLPTPQGAGRLDETISRHTLLNEEMKRSSMPSLVAPIRWRSCRRPPTPCPRSTSVYDPPDPAMEIAESATRADRQAADRRGLGLQEVDRPALRVPVATTSTTSRTSCT